MSVPTDLWRMSATELAAAIRSKQVSSRDVVQAHLRRITEVNPAVNAVTVVLTERALDAATTADRRPPPVTSYHRCTASRSRSRGTSTSPEHRQRRD
ncbi:MAG TPA: hypothetical protein VIJ23_16195 [Mycobacterium sp.]